MIVTLLKKDLKLLAYSPFIWLYLCLFQFISTWIYFIHIDQFMATQTQMIASNALYTVSDRIVIPFFKSMGLVSTLFLPFITMSLISKEKQQKTFTLLSASPITLFQVTFSKLLTAISIIFVMTMLLSIMIALLTLGTNINLRLLLTCSVAFILLNTAIASMGLFLSSLTRQPIIAGLATLGFLLLTILFGWNAENTDTLLKSISLHTHYNALLSHIINTSHIVYLLVFTLLMFGWSLFKLSSESWRQ
ncbi:MAG: ABC transporter permease subunit [Methylococcales bacterium]|jgi:ABC-2 type transport system permease protein|nr:ABC transporter permease subunit [Methylococcales bacterium]MBT7443144.1 ABC transporter permease subunit [Methylococcales bacterium]